MYIPLTKEQFQKARNAGFSPEKIIEMEQKRKVSQSAETTELVEEDSETIQPTFKASMGAGLGSILGNTAKTFGNLPSSGAEIINKTVISPAKNIQESEKLLGDIFRDRGFKEGTKDIIKGTGETLGKIFKAPGEFLVNKNKQMKDDLSKDKEQATLRKQVDELTNQIYDAKNKKNETLRKELVIKLTPLQNRLSELNSAVGTKEDRNVKSLDKLIGITKYPIERPAEIPVLIATGPETKGKDFISKISNKVTGEVDTSISNIVSTLTKKSEQQIESIILKKYEKGVRPLLPGKTTPSKLQDYREDVVDAVKTIKQNKDALSFNSEAGEVVSGQTPKSLQQLSDAVEQTKKTIFKQYDSLAKEAGNAGVSVEMSPIASELDAVINNKALGITNPNAIKYAKETQKRILEVGKLDAETAQEVIQNYNKSLEAFYRNPSYDNASQAAIDAMIANRMRKVLDEGITSLTGAEYSVLKKKYGSLKAIEKDVIKATLRDARKNTKGLIDFTDIFSGGQVVNGILTLNPATMAQGLTAKAIAEFYKYLNNPNRAIEKMFNVADKLP